MPRNTRRRYRRKSRGRVKGGKPQVYQPPLPVSRTMELLVWAEQEIKEISTIVMLEGIKPQVKLSALQEIALLKKGCALMRLGLKGPKARKRESLPLNVQIRLRHQMMLDVAKEAAAMDAANLTLSNKELTAQ